MQFELELIQVLYLNGKWTPHSKYYIWMLDMLDSYVMNVKVFDKYISLIFVLIFDFIVYTWCEAKKSAY